MSTVDENGCFNPLWTAAVMFSMVMAWLFFAPTNSTITMIPEVMSQPAEAGIVAGPVEPTHRVILAPAEEATPEALSAVEDILSYRLEILSSRGRLAEAYSISVDSQAQRITLEIAQGTDALEDALAFILAPGRFELVDFTGLSRDELNALTGTRILTINQPANPEVSNPVIYEVVLDNDQLQAAVAASDNFGNWIIEVAFTPEGAAILGAFSEAHIGQGLGIVVDGIVLTAPTLQARIDTSAVITGDYSREEAQAIADRIRGPVIPLTLVLESITLLQP